MTDTERKARLEMALDLIQMQARSAQLVSLEDAEALVHELSRAETLMPLLDPTAYIRGQKTLAVNKQLVEAFLAFRRVVARVVEAGK